MSVSECVSVCVCVCVYGYTAAHAFHATSVAQSSSAATEAGAAFNC